MQAEAQQALRLWGMDAAQAVLAARRENTVWRVVMGDQAYALRFHRPGYRTAAELRSELHWMRHLALGGLNVPDPIPMSDGAMIGQIGAHPVSLLTWLPGRPIGAQGALHDIADPAALCRQLGRDMARLHDLSDDWLRPLNFTRPDWRRDGLLGDSPVWGRFWDHPHLTADQRALLLDTRAAAAEALAQIEPTADQGLIHADMLTENVLIHDGDLAIIDFDDGAFGFRDFELATFLGKFLEHPGFETMRAALCDGYATRRQVRHSDLDLFLLLRALTYPGWIMERLNDPGGAQRSARALTVALNAAETYLNRRPR